MADVCVLSISAMRGPESPSPSMVRMKWRRLACPCTTRRTHARSSCSSYPMTPLLWRGGHATWNPLGGGPQEPAGGHPTTSHLGFLYHTLTCAVNKKRPLRLQHTPPCSTSPSFHARPVP